eukprot:scaffold3556_cov67-Attheya_sp.AAC.9
MDTILGGIKAFREGIPLGVHVGSKLSCLLSIFVGAMLGASFGPCRATCVGNELDKSVGDESWNKTRLPAGQQRRDPCCHTHWF